MPLGDTISIAYSGQIGHLIRDYTGHLSERSDADIYDLQKWPIRVKESVSICLHRSPFSGRRSPLLSPPLHVGAYCSVPRRWGGCEQAVSFVLLSSHGSTYQFKEMGIMYEPVKNGICYSRVADCVVPELYGELTGD